MRLRYVVVNTIAVIMFAVHDEGGNGASYGGISVKTVTTELSNMVMASFGDG